MVSGFNAVDTRKHILANGDDILAARTVAGVGHPYFLSAAVQLQTVLSLLQGSYTTNNFLPSFPLLAPTTLQFFVTGDLNIYQQNIIFAPGIFSPAAPLGSSIYHSQGQGTSLYSQAVNAAALGRLIDFFV